MRIRLKFIALVLPLVLAGCGGMAGNTSANPNSAPPPPPPPPAPAPADLTAVNHIIFMMQENQSFDRYFGQLNTYRQAQGLGADVEVTPPTASQLAFDGSTSFTPFHMQSMCAEELSSYWNESHNDWNHEDPTSATAMMDGFANSAGNNSRATAGFDINGQRVMGYYDNNDLPFYYFMATQFAMSDHWFAPVMTNTPASRLYAMAATSRGIINKPLTQINIKTIFDELQAANVTWKDYVQDYPNGSSLKPFPAFTKYVGTNIVPFSQYADDLNAGTLPQVAFIERDSKDGLDEHPGPGISVQKGAAYVENKIVIPLMNSSSWKDSVFFLTYDEGGGFYDHVPPIVTVPPDDIAPMVDSNDTCSADPTAPMCSFGYTGFRLPNIVVSPFAKAHYVDHTPMDTTSILTFIEKRFKLGALTNRDAAQPDISFFFDFGGAPNMNPPTPPAQPTSGPCYVNALP